MYHSLSYVKIDTKEKVFPLLGSATKQYDINSRTCWNILKNKTLSKNTLKIKKAVVGQQPLELLERRIMNNKQETKNLLQK